MSIKSVGSLWLLADRLISYTFEELAWASFFFTSSPSYPFLRKVSSCSCWPQTHYIAGDGLKLLLKSVIFPVCMGCVYMCIYICDSGYTLIGEHLDFRAQPVVSVPFPNFMEDKVFFAAFSLCIVCSGSTSFG